MAATHGQAILSLCVSDINKNLLLASEHFLTLAVDSLLLDPEHPRMNNAAMQGTTDWEAVKAPVQRDFADLAAGAAQVRVMPLVATSSVASIFIQSSVSLR